MYFGFLFDLVLVVLSLRCCMGAFSGCSERRLLSSCGAWASHGSGFFCCGAQARGMQTQ